MMTLVSEALQFPFFVRALLVGMMLACMCALLGNFVIMRKESLIGHTLSNVAFLGVALGLLWQLPFFVSVLGTLALGLTLILALTFRRTFSSDSILAFVSQVSMAGAIVAMSMLQGYQADPMQYLFGDILAVQTVDLWYVSGLSVLVLLLLFFFWRPFFQIAFHEELAESGGVRVNVFHLLYLLMIALVVSVGMKLIGVVLLVAFLVIPANTAKSFASSFRQMVGFSALFGVVGTVLGLFMSYIFDTPSGATVILCLSAIFLCTLLLTRMVQRIR